MVYIFFLFYFVFTGSTIVLKSDCRRDLSIAFGPRLLGNRKYWSINRERNRASTWTTIDTKYVVCVFVFITVVIVLSTFRRGHAVGGGDNWTDLDTAWHSVCVSVCTNTNVCNLMLPVLFVRFEMAKSHTFVLLQTEKYFNRKQSNDIRGNNAKAIPFPKGVLR